MKTSAIPAVRVEPQLRQQAEGVLAEGESLSQFIEAAVRDSVARRTAQAEFIARGMASLVAARHDGEFVSTASVLRKLETRLAKARARR